MTLYASGIYEGIQVQPLVCLYEMRTAISAYSGTP